MKESFHKMNIGIYDAVWNGDINAVKALVGDIGSMKVTLVLDDRMRELLRELEIGDDLNPITLPVVAILRGHADVCQFLLERDGLALQTLFRFGEYSSATILHLATYAGHPGICTMLLNKGAAQEPDSHGRTPLLIAAGRNQSVCQVLLENGATDLPDKNGTTALHVAAAGGYTGICDLLVEFEATDYSTDVKGMTPLDMAINNGHEETCEFLIHHGAPVVPEVRYVVTDPITGQLIHPSLLHLASAKGMKKVCALILDKGIGVDDIDKDGQTPLFVAAQNCHREVCELLLDRGATTNKANNQGWTPLRIAIKHGHKDVCEMLLERGAAKELVGKAFSLTPLHLATINGHTEICHLLIAHGATLESTPDGGSLLYLAAEAGILSLCLFFLEHGVNQDVTAYGWSPLMIAARHGHRDICDLLIEHGADLEETLKIVRERGWQCASCVTATKFCSPHDGAPSWQPAYLKAFNTLSEVRRNRRRERPS